MAQGVAFYLQPLTAAVDMMPVFQVRAAWIGPQIDMLKILSAPGGKPRMGPAGVAAIGKFHHIALAAPGTRDTKHASASVQGRVRAHALFVQQGAAPEAIQREAGV